MSPAFPRPVQPTVSGRSFAPPVAAGPGRAGRQGGAPRAAATAGPGPLSQSPERCCTFAASRPAGAGLKCRGRFCRETDDLRARIARPPRCGVQGWNQRRGHLSPRQSKNLFPGADSVIDLSRRIAPYCPYCRQSHKIWCLGGTRPVEIARDLPRKTPSDTGRRRRAGIERIAGGVDRPSTVIGEQGTGARQRRAGQTGDRSRT